MFHAMTSAELGVAASAGRLIDAIRTAAVAAINLRLVEVLLVIMLSVPLVFMALKL
jgi:hypothetical protein